jgi:hypothetical protein
MYSDMYLVAGAPGESIEKMAFCNEVTWLNDLQIANAVSGARQEYRRRGSAKLQVCIACNLRSVRADV